MGQIEHILLYFHIKWGGLIAKELIFILGVQRSNLISDIVVVNNGTMLTICTLHN
jgi:hypothetical protein